MTELSSTIDFGDHFQALRPALLRVPSRAAFHEPEDFVQEAFVRALSRPELEPERLSGWLRTVVKNLGHDAFRRDRCAVAANVRLAKAEVVEPDHAEAVAHQDLAKAAADWAQDLPCIQRDVLFAVAEGHSIGEVASSHGLSLRAAEGHLRRARQALRKRMNA